jgi:hypothetical protein
MEQEKKENTSFFDKLIFSIIIVILSIFSVIYVVIGLSILFDKYTNFIKIPLLTFFASSTVSIFILILLNINYDLKINFLNYLKFLFLPFIILFIIFCYNIKWKMKKK